MADKVLIGGPPPANVTEWPPGAVYFQVERLDTKTSGAAKAVTAPASTDIFASVGHGFVAGDKVRFTALTGGAPLTTGTQYFVIAANLSADAFQVSTTAGGAAVNLTADLTAGQAQKMVADATGATVELTVWSQMGVNQIDWGDNVIVGPLGWSVAPAADKALGQTVATHSYTGRAGSLYQAMFESGLIRRRFQVEAGEPAIIDDVTRDGIKRPPEDSQTQIFAQRRKLASATRKQMAPSARPPREGGMVN